MSEPELGPPPAGSPIAVEMQGEDMVITYRSPGAEWGFWIAAGVLIVLAVLIAMCAWTLGVEFVVQFGAGGVILAVVMASRATSQAIFRVNGERLYLATSTIFRNTTREWPRDEIRGIVAFRRRLHIITTRGKETYLAHRLEAELAWLAEALTSTLRLDPKLLAHAGEIEVTFNRLGERAWSRGFFRAEPGLLALRWPAEEAPTFVFFNAGGYGAAEFHQQRPGNRIPLSVDEVLCRVEDDGGASLQIDKHWMNLNLTIWCADKDVMHAALARFWGATEDS
jgi:hypothetical protein